MTGAADSASPDQTLDGRPGPAENGVTASVVATSEAGAADPSPTAASAPGAPVDWLLVAWITLLAAGTAVIGMAFLPLYIGSIPLPISALLGVAAMILAPRACYRLTGSLIAALLPVAAWFAVSVWLVLARNSLIGATDTAGALVGLPVSVSTGQWRVMVLLGLGSLAAAATVGLIWGDRLRDRLAAERAAAQARDDAAERAAAAELR
jgi:hypothetical protein